MSILGWTGLALALLGALQPAYRERVARRIAGCGILLLLLDVLRTVLELRALAAA